MPAIDRDFGTLYYRTTGRGAQSVVLLHEYFGTGDSWAAQRSFLTRYFPVITPDLRGHGRSVMTPGRITVTDVADDIEALLDNLGITAAHIIGCSLGAVVALHLARTNPDRVLSLAATSVPLSNDPAVIRYGREYVEAIFPRLEAGLDRLHGQEQPGYARGVLLRNFEQDLDQAPRDHVDATERSGEIGKPALVVAGDRDPVMPPERALRLASRIPSASLAIFPSTGHLVHQEMPALFNQTILDHLIRTSMVD